MKSNINSLNKLFGDNNCKERPRLKKGKYLYNFLISYWIPNSSGLICPDDIYVVAACVGSALDAAVNFHPKHQIGSVTIQDIVANSNDRGLT